MKNTGNYKKDFIIEKDGLLFYVTDFDLKEKKETYFPHFTSFIQKDLPTSDKERHSKPIDLSYLRTFTFLVLNNGLNPILCQVEMSPDGVTWESFGELELTISPAQKQVIVPQFFLRFVRLKFRNKNQGFNSVVTIWFQGQS